MKDWDLQRQRLPDSRCRIYDLLLNETCRRLNGSFLNMFSSCSNAEKVRQFIRNVYVDRRYAGGKDSEKPPKDMQAI